MGGLDDWMPLMMAVTLVLLLLVFLKVDALSVLVSTSTSTTDGTKTSGFLNNTALWAPGRNTEFSGTNQGFRTKPHLPPNPHHHRNHPRQGFESPSFWTSPVDEHDMNRLAEMQKEPDMVSGFAAGRSVNEGRLVGALSGR